MTTIESRNVIAAELAESLNNGNRTDVRTAITTDENPAWMALAVARHFSHQTGHSLISTIVNLQTLVAPNL